MVQLGGLERHEVVCGLQRLVWGGAGEPIRYARWPRYKYVVGTMDSHQESETYIMILERLVCLVG